MSGLYPTPTRLRLLAQARDGQITIDSAGRARDAHGHRVEVRLQEMARYGWLKTVARKRPDGDGFSYRWEITDRGLEELAKRERAVSGDA